MKRKSLHLSLLAITLLSTVAFAFGGWGVVTVDDVPDYLEAGKPTKLAFKVRQHGLHPLEDLSPKVTLRSGLTKSSVMAVGSADPKGRYVATLTPPHAGEWTVRIESGFRSAELTLLPIRAVGSDAPAPAAMSDADRGQRLFYAKGCVTCHVRGDDGDDGNKGAKPGPELTARRYVVANLSKFLVNPATNPLSSVRTSNWRMPDLELKEREIASLVAFINSEKKLSSR